ncbi:stereocilin-like [Cheilinus undulatus]|uniref:stereocilin-like n=1 Tax=Cheilinus undulatus TaxID=241271 RepID=UPI001BD33B34|nr:stereocilin-like [Cheilinus undulatus]
MAEKWPQMATLRITSIIVCAVLLGQGSSEKTGGSKEEQRDAILREIISKWSSGGGWSPQKAPTETNKDQSVHPWMRNIMGSLKTIFPSKKLPSLNKPIDRHRLSGFLYNISLYLQEMGAELEEAPTETDEEQLWEKVLHFFLQSEGSAAMNQWNGRVPPRPSVRVQDWFLSLRGSPHWDWLLGLLQSLITLSERQPYRPLLTYLSQNWRTVSAVLEAALQALVSGTYGQASAGLQGFICALKGRSDCAFSVSWLQQLLRFLETRHWKPVVSLHPIGEGADHSKSSSAFGRFKPFSLPPEALRKDAWFGNASFEDSVATEDDPDSMQSFLLQALSRSGGGDRGGHLAQKNLALVQSLDGLRRGLLHRVGSSVYDNLRRKVSQATMALLDDVSSLVDVPQPNVQGQCSIGDLRQLILWGIRHNVTWNTEALGVGSQGLPSSLPFLSCPSSDEDEPGSGQKRARSSPKPAPSSRKINKQKHPQDRKNGRTRESNYQHKDLEYSTSLEILEAACNESIPGLTGVSNFTVFLYCKLFEGENGSVSSAVAQMGLDLHATCSDAAWYLSAAEEDFLWVHVCSEFFAQEFNNTVCANSSFWLQKAQQAVLTKDYHFFNQTSIDDLCVRLTDETTSNPGLEESCLSQLGSRMLTAQAFRNCFLPNNSVLIAALCGRDSPESLPEGSWAAAYCSKLHNLTHADTVEESCQYRDWDVHDFTNFTLLESCRQTHGLREHICLNVTLYSKLLRSVPQFSELCADLQAEQEEKKCFLQRFFDMLPARYEFDTSQLCMDPAPLLVDVLHKLSVCEVQGGERQGFLLALGYVFRVLDFMVGLSSGLDEGEREARQGLSQAILLSSLLDNTSWAELQPQASMSVLHTVGVFLRREQNATLKEDLLSCFSPVLWDLIQQNDNSSALRVLLQEYLQMPRDSIRTLVMSAEKDAVKRFLSHMHQSWDQLQVETGQASQKELQAMETMTAAFIHKFPRVTPELFVDLSQFIPFMSVSDIMSFPASLIVNDTVLTAIRDHSSGMKSLQKKAFVKRLLQSSVVGDVPTWPPYFLTSILPLLPYLPVSHFQQLTSQQLTPLIELLGNSGLDGVRGRHVLRTLFSKKNLTSDHIVRLGVLICYMDPEDLSSFLQDSPVSSTLWQQLAQCMCKGFISPSGRLSAWLIQTFENMNISSLAPPELSALSGLLPQLGASFLQSLPSQQLMEIFSQPGIHRYSPAQAFQILAKISKDIPLTVEKLCRLKPLLCGLSPAVLRDLQWAEISQAAHCQCLKMLLNELKPGHRAMIYNAVLEVMVLLSALNFENITQQVNCLSPFVPLKKLTETIKGETILRDISLYRDMLWSPQQAQLLFRKVQEFKNISRKFVRNLGHIASGMSCDFLRRNSTYFAELLQFITELPGSMRPALRKCIVEELRNYPELDLNFLSSGFAATLPVTMLETLSNVSFRAILSHIQANFADFLRLPHYKQTNLAERAVSELSSQAEEEIDGTTLDVLGPLLPFLDRDSLALVDRRALSLRLEEMRSFCLPKEALRDISTLLTQKDLLGEPSKWQVSDVEHLGRLVFSLSTKQINSIPLPVLNKDTVEQVLVGQSLWEDSTVGGVCVTRCMDKHRHRRQTQSLIRGIVKARSRRAKVPVPSCADIRGTFPSAWTSTQLSRMSQEDLEQCVEVFAQDASLNSEQRRALWGKLRQFYSPVKELRADQVLALGSVVTEMGERELQDTNLTDPSVLAHLGILTDWSPKKMRAVILGVMRKRKVKVEQLTAVDLAIFGHLICGLYPSEIKRLSGYNLSIAAVFLREVSLPCTEQQMEMLTSRLSRPEAFGPVSAWGPEVFTEIGTLAVGLEDMVLSALVQEQVEGITPEAIALMSKKKMAVVFSALQLSWLSAEQAWAVTEEQWEELDSEQRHAVGLARYEGDVLLELRGRNSAPEGLSTHSFPLHSLLLCLLLWQLI